MEDEKLEVEQSSINNLSHHFDFRDNIARRVERIGDKNLRSILRDIVFGNTEDNPNAREE